MRISLRALGMAAFAGSLVVGASGCKVEGSASTPVRYNASDIIEEEAWGGGDVTVDGLYGNIEVVEGAADTVRVTFEPFHYWDPDEEEEARQMLADHLQTVVEPDGDGVHISTGRSGGGSNGIGADITVELPSNFAARLVVENRSNGPIDPGNVRVRFVGEATSVSVSTDSLGDCRIDGAPSVTQTTADCDGAVRISGVTDNVDITTTGLETAVSVDLTVASVSAESGGGTINSEDGDVNLTFPATGDYSILALTNEGVINEGSLPESCTVEAAEERSKTITCGAGGPQYHVNACRDGVGECIVNIQYQ